MKKFIALILVPALWWTQPAAAAMPLERLEVTGTLQQWSATAKTAMVAGKIFQMADDVQYLDGAAKAVSRSTLRTGARVMLLLADGKVTHVIVNPAQISPLDQPRK